MTFQNVNMRQGVKKYMSVSAKHVLSTILKMLYTQNTNVLVNLKGIKIVIGDSIKILYVSAYSFSTEILYDMLIRENAYKRLKILCICETDLCAKGTTLKKVCTL